MIRFFSLITPLVFWFALGSLAQAQTLLVEDSFEGSYSANWTPVETFFRAENYTPNTSAQKYVSTPTPEPGDPQGKTFGKWLKGKIR